MRACGECGAPWVFRASVDAGTGKVTHYAGADHDMTRDCYDLSGVGDSRHEAWADLVEVVRHRTEGCPSCQVIAGCDCAHCRFGHLCREEA